MIWVNAVIQGVLLGGLYALFATGLSIGFGVMRLVNLAHGDLSILAAFVAFSLADALSINPLVALVLILPGAFVVGFVLQRLVFDHVVGVDPAYQIVATFGLSIVIQNALLAKYTADSRGLRIGRLATSSIHVNDKIGIGWLPLLTFLCGVAVLGALALFLNRTGMGRALYHALFQLLILQGFYQCFAGITLPNSASVSLHESLGFQPVGVYQDVGYKLGVWHDVGWWQRELRAPAEPLAPAPFGTAAPRKSTT